MDFSCPINYNVEVFIQLIMCHQNSVDSSQSHRFSPIIIVHLLLFGQSKNKVTSIAINTINIFIHQLSHSLLNYGLLNKQLDSYTV